MAAPNRIGIGAASFKLLLGRLSALRVRTVGVHQGAAHRSGVCTNAIAQTGLELIHPVSEDVSMQGWRGVHICLPLDSDGRRDGMACRLAASQAQIFMCQWPILGVQVNSVQAKAA